MDYEYITTFWQDFSTAELFGEDAIRDTAKRAFDEWKDDKLHFERQFTSAPNPAHDRTTLRIEHNLTNAVQSAIVDIYDIRGSHVRQFTPTLLDNSCVIAIPWDFRSDNGDQVANGIYVARVMLTTTSGEVLTQTTKVIRN